MQQANNIQPTQYTNIKFNPNSERKFYIETYGCQMNVADSELVASIMIENGFSLTEKMEEAEILFVNTCSIRENAEQRVRGRLDVFRLKKEKKSDVIIGVLGCMAERLKTKLLEEEKMVDLVIGPDAYRDLPNLLKKAESGQEAVNVLLSREETYADISPVRYNSNNVTAFVSIMRGCDNMCAYCVVPFTRGRERSRKPETIIGEVKELVENDFKELTLIGQNVDKYLWNNELNFAMLLETVAKFAPKMRIRFATSYPHDLTDEVLMVMARNTNICKCIHLPVQSGSNAILDKMKRNYTREWYLNRVEAIRRILLDCAITTDIIVGFCSETEENHRDTLSLMEKVGFDFAFMFKYSERPNTFAQRFYSDDVSESEKTRRLSEIIELQQKNSHLSNLNDLGKTFEVLVEGVSKKSNDRLFGRNSQNKVVVFDRKNHKVGDFAMVRITNCTSATLLGEVL